MSIKLDGRVNLKSLINGFQNMIYTDYIKEFNSVPIDVASKMLSTVSGGIHPSSPGYAMAQAMS